MTKRYILNLLLLPALALGASGCKDTLDTHPTTTFDDAVVWGSKATAEAFITATYANVVTGSGYAGGGTCVDWEARTPNSVKCSQVGEGIDHFATELGLNRNVNYGINRTGVLRRCNLILEKVAASTFLSNDEKKVLSAHGHFLRGLVFFDQTRTMGRILPFEKVLTQSDEEAAKLPMTANVAESYKYVIADLEKAAEGLPERNRSGLPTKWVAGVILGRACLQAYAYTGDNTYLDKAITVTKNVIDNSGVTLSNSTGMFNENDDKNPEILWGYYRLSKDTEIGGYAELIRTYPNISTADNSNAGSPNPLLNAAGASTFEGWAIYFPTQDLVDQFLVIDQKTGEALPWYETSQYLENVEELDPKTVTKPGQVDSYNHKTGPRRMPSPQDLTQTKEGYPVIQRYARIKPDAQIKNISEIMYSHRDRRFATAIVYDQCKWVGETIETNLRGNLSAGVRDKEDGGWYNTVTSYYWRKSNIENPDPRAYFNCKVALHYNIVRLGEAYMNLAEAYLLKKDVPKAVEALNQTRTVHGGLPASKATTEEAAWNDYIRERTVEMTNEGGDLYYSYLRWGKYGGYANHGRAAGDIIYDLDRPVYKMQINRDRTAILVNQVTLLNSANRNFTTKRYLLPVAQSFLDKREAYALDHAQNEGW